MNWTPKIGMKVVCISLKDLEWVDLELGAVYTLNHVELIHGTRIGSVHGVGIEENKSKYCAELTFRPLEDNFAEQALETALEGGKELDETLEQFKEKEKVK